MVFQQAGIVPDYVRIEKRPFAVLQSIPHELFESLLLYQDEPTYGLLLKLFVVIMPIAMLAASIYIFRRGTVPMV